MNQGSAGVTAIASTVSRGVGSITNVIAPDRHSRAGATEDNSMGYAMLGPGALTSETAQTLAGHLHTAVRILREDLASMHEGGTGEAEEKGGGSEVPRRLNEALADLDIVEAVLRNQMSIARASWHNETYDPLLEAATLRANPGGTASDSARAPAPAGDLDTDPFSAPADDPKFEPAPPVPAGDNAGSGAPAPAPPLATFNPGARGRTVDTDALFGPAATTGNQDAIGGSQTDAFGTVFDDDDKSGLFGPSGSAQSATIMEEKPKEERRKGSTATLMNGLLEGFDDGISSKPPPAAAQGLFDE